MKDSDITVYKSFLLKLFYGAPGWPVSRFRPGVLVFILPDFGRDTDDLGGQDLFCSGLDIADCFVKRI